MTATLTEANEEQADTVDVLDVNTSSNRIVALEPSNTSSSSEQVTLQKPIPKQPITPQMYLALTPDISIEL